MYLDVCVISVEVDKGMVILVGMVDLLVECVMVENVVWNVLGV